MADVIGFVLIRIEGNILVQLRDNNSQIPYPGYWVMPGGGVKEGESSRDATAREIREEHGLIVTPGALFFLCSYLRESDGVKADIFAYLLGETEDLELREGQCIRFIPFEELAQMELGFEQQRYIVPHVLQHLRLVVN